MKRKINYDIFKEYFLPMGSLRKKKATKKEFRTAVVGYKSAYKFKQPCRMREREKAKRIFRMHNKIRIML
jgi:hypothetical protein